MKKSFFARISLSLATAVALAACSGDSGSTKVLDNPETPENPDNPEKTSFYAGSVSGSVEGEKYLDSAKVELFELSGDMERTGKSVTGDIDAAGKYMVVADSFTTPYAEVVVSGMAQWPCSGAKKDSWISAVVDVTKDSSVNLNLFTSFASAKTKSLVKKDNMEFSKAWEQAEKDVRKWFALPAEGASIKTLRFSGEGRSLELNELSLLHERIAFGFSEVGFSKFREGTSDLFAQTAELNKDEIFYSLGFAAYTFDMDMRYNQWCASTANLTSDDADYRAYAHLLWLSLMGEEECSASLKDSIHKVESPDDLIAIYNSPRYYVCDGKEWRLAKIEAVPLQFPNPEDGDLVTSYGYDYVYDKESGWRYATKTELEVKVGCVKSRKGSIKDAYFCADSGWVEIPELDQNLGAYCNADSRGDTVHVGYSSFVCDSAWKVIPADSLDEWVEDPRDGKSYLIVPMGSQRWMGANLRYRDSVKTPNLAGNTWCFENWESYCSGLYGVLYSWTAAMDLPDDVKADTVKLKLPHRGICPEGWHVPSKADWDTLFAFVKKFGPKDKLALTLMGKKDWAGGAHTPTLNTFGFNALPSGRRKVDGTYEGEYHNAYFWYTAETFKKLPYYYMTYAQPDIDENSFGDTDWAAAVRCVEDAK
jgi:uncharacterized protein (TIGR02145 family)